MEGSYLLSKTPFLLAGLCLLFVGLLIFRNFVLNGKTLLYTDMGSDSVNDTYPWFVHLSDYIRWEGFPSWSFFVGMGQGLAYRAGDLIWQPIVWLPRELIPRGLVFQHLFKTLVAGLLFLRFLQLRGVNLCASLLGSLLLSFSAYMCMGSCWNINADEVVCFTFLLFAVEEAICEGRWIYIPFAVALIGLVSAFHLYLGALLLCCYVPARLVEIYGWRPALVSRVCFQLAGIALLGIGLAAIVFLEGLNTILNSPRGSGTIANSWLTPTLFQLESPLHYITIFLRSFSNDIIGTGNDFRGWGNYFEAPTNYCGLFSLLIFPQVFSGATRRRRIFCGIFLILITMPVLLPWFRHLFWLFHGGYYRTLSLFSIFGIIALSMKTFSRYVESKGLNLLVLTITLVALLGVLYLPIGEMQTLVNPAVRRTIAIFLILYATLLATGQILKRQSVFGWIIVVSAAIELIYFDRMTVDRPTVTKQQLAERSGYNDQTVDAIRDIRAHDKSFFRVTKTWSSGPAMYPSFNDAMIFGYFGTSLYSSFNNLNYIDFLLASDAISSADIITDAQWSPGLVGHPLLSTFACEKYVITKNPVPFQSAGLYEFVREYSGIYLFRNKLSLPFGLTFTSSISKEMFLQLPSSAKAQALFHAVVLSDDKTADTRELPELTLSGLKQRIDETALPDILAERRTTALHIRSFGQTHIDGTVRLERKGILVLQTPFDRGWLARMDGRSVPVLKVDIGLLGVLLEGGEHIVELRYRPPFLYIGAAITAISCVILALGRWRWPRIQLPQ